MTRRTQEQKRQYSLPTVPRRTVLKGAAATGLFVTVPWGTGRVRALDGETLDPDSIPKWEDPLPRPGVMEPVSKKEGVDRYEIDLTQFTQQVLPNSMTGKDTTLWGYGGTYPAATIEARPGRKVEVEYINELPPHHLLSVDTRIHGAEEDVPEVRTVTHLHGGVVAPEDDGYPEAWVGVEMDGMDRTLVPNPDPDNLVPYKQPKEYPNDQQPGTLWYHDHALGITRLNVYAGLAGFYLLRDPMENSLPSGKYEVPILIQDRSFDEDGELFYPAGDDDAYEAEFAGNVPVVNGKAYPYLEVEPRTYRFRFLNGSNGRTFNLNLYNENADNDTDVPLFQQIGVDLGFLEEVVTVGPGGDVPSLLLSGAERADVIVDFSDHENTTFTLTNNAEFPYTGENDGPDIDSIGEIMQFRVTDSVSNQGGNKSLSEFLRAINRKYPEPDVMESGTTRYMTLDSGEHNGLDTHFLNLALWDDGPTTWNGDPRVVRPELGTSEEWMLANTTGDSHPIHIHLVDFEVLGRHEFDAAGFTAARDDYMDDNSNPKPSVSDYLGGSQPPTLNNRIKKDTVLVNPDEAVRIRPAFTGFTGYFVWHCHILEHEDQEMMLPYVVMES